VVALRSREVIALDIEEHDRALAKRELAWFIRYWFKQRKQTLNWNWHLDYLCDLLTAVWKRQVLRLIVNMPPRSLKSEVILAWHAWMIGQEDNHRSSLLNTAAAASLAVRDSRRTRDMLASRWYRNLFPQVKLTMKTDAEWHTTGGAWRLAIGMDGMVTGKGADHLTWDDILLPRDAFSEVMKQRARDFLGDTLRSRRNDQLTGTITGIQQRICEDDPTGHLIRQMQDPLADQYMIVTMPQEAERKTVVEWNGKVYAKRESGDLLHPARVDRKEWERIKRSQPHTYRAQHQQDPQPGDGGELTPKDIQEAEGTAQEIARKWGLRPRFYLDLASTEKETQKDDPDFSVIAVVARDELDRFWILDLWRGQVRHNHLLDRLLALWDKWKPTRVTAESGGSWNGLMAVYDERCRRMGRRPFKLDGVTPHRDKVSRAQPLRALLMARQVFVPAGAPWLHDMKAEMARFPLGSHDDQVDALAYAAMDSTVLPVGAAPARVLSADHNPGEDGITGAELEKLIDKARAGRGRAMEREGFSPRTRMNW
jgi:predicted phage terminase large subunit-like protein